jgi:hypothetical protein
MTKTMQTILFVDMGHGGLDPMTQEYLTPEINREENPTHKR